MIINLFNLSIFLYRIGMRRAAIALFRVIFNSLPRLTALPWPPYSLHEVSGLVERIGTQDSSALVIFHNESDMIASSYCDDWITCHYVIKRGRLLKARINESYDRMYS